MFSAAQFPVHTSHGYFIYCSWPEFYSLFHVLKFKCGKHYPYPPRILLLLLLWGGEGFFFSPSPSTSFLLWNVSNGQRLTSDWLNSKTISFVLMFLFENSDRFAQGKKWQSDLLHTHSSFRLGNFSLRGSTGYFWEERGVLRVARCGRATCLDLTLLPSWLWGCPGLDCKCLQRRE